MIHAAQKHESPQQGFARASEGGHMAGIYVEETVEQVLASKQGGEASEMRK
jgi:hypothetical protein